MAKLTKCKDCGREMSKRAKVCPGCGAPNRGQYGIGRSIVVLFLGLVILMVVGVCVQRARLAFSGGTPSGTSSSSQR